MGIKERILDYVRSSGPSTYAEIASRLGIDSIFVSAVLEDAWKNRELLRTPKFKFGRIYYFKDQISRVRQEIWNLLLPQERGILQKLVDQKVLIRSELEDDELEILKKFSIFFDSFRARVGDRIYQCWKHHSVSNEEVKSILASRLKEVRKPKEEKKFIRPKEDFREIIRNWFKRIGAKIEEEESRKKVIEWVISLPMPFGDQTYLVKAKNYKRKINEGDISLAYIKGMERKLPVIYISSAGFTQKALDFCKEHYKGLVTLITLEDVRKA